MELIQQQRLLARLYTDANLRSRILAEPEKLGETFGLDAVAARAFSKQLEGFARSLQRKRLTAIVKVFPRTRQAMGRNFDQLFLGYSRTPARDDANGFSDYLRNCGRNLPMRQLELARFEASCLRARHKRFLVRRFRFQSRKPIIVMWFRLRPSGHVWQLALSRWGFTSRLTYL